MAKPLAGSLESPDAIAERWAGLWSRADGGWLSHHPAFLAAAATGGRAAVAVVRNGSGELLAVAPFLEEKRGMARVLRHLAPASFAGVWTKDEERFSGDESWRREILEALGAALETTGRATMVMPPGLADVRPLMWRGWTAQPHYNVVSKWESAAAFETGMSSSARRQLKKALRSGLVADEVPLAGLEEIRARTSERKGFRDVVRPEGYAAIAALSDVPPFKTLTLAVRDGSGTLHAGALFAADARRAYYLLGASNEEALGSGAPTLLHVEAVRRFEALGWPHEYDWVGANEPGPAAFKSNFPTEIETLMRVDWRGGAAKLLDAVRGRS